MAYIAPNSTIKFLQRVPIDNSYDDTLWFASISAQTNYFNSMVKANTGGYSFTLSNQYYQRVNRGWLRVNIPADYLMDCNYLMFNNTAYHNKWFYAFITAVEYVNNNVAEVQYQLDVMQTWFFEAIFGGLEQCYVIREHSETDAIGDNLIPEPVNEGVYVSGYPYQTGMFTDWGIVVVVTSKALQSTIGAFQVADGCFIAGDYNNVDIGVFPATAQGIADIKSFLNTIGLTSKEETIANMYMFPKGLLPLRKVNDEYVIDEDTGMYEMRSTTSWANSVTYATSYFQPVFLVDEVNQNNTYGIELPVSQTVGVFNGYTPKNNKLYTYPYNYFVVSNQQGETQVYMYEQCFRGTNDEIAFTFVVDYGVEPCVMCFPLGYMQKDQNGTEIVENIDKGISLRNFPRCGYATTDLGAKLVQAGIGLALGAAVQGAEFVVPGSIELMGSSPEITYPYKGNSMVPYSGKISNAPNNSLAETSGFNTSPRNEQLVYTPDKNYNIKLPVQDAVIASAIAKSVYNSQISGTIGAANPLVCMNGLDFIFKQVFLDAPYAKVIDDYFTMYGYQTNAVKVPNIHARRKFTYTRTANCKIISTIPNNDSHAIEEIFNHGVRFWADPNVVGMYNIDNSPLI